MAQQAAEDQGGTERAGRGPLWPGKPAGAAPAEVEARLVRLETGFDDLKSYFERSEERWEKWRSEQQQQAEFREEIAAGFQRLDEKIDAVREETSERIGRLAESVDRRFD